MMPTIRHPLPYRQRGLSMGLIMVAVALLAVIGMALMLSEKTGTLTSETRIAGVRAATLVQQAATLRSAWQNMARQIGTPVYLEFNTSDMAMGLFNPSAGTTEVQTPPVAAFANTANVNWIYKVDGSSGINGGNPVVYLNNVGDANTTSWLVAVTGLQSGVCGQINQQLLGTTVIPAPAAGASTDWETPATVIDLRNDPTVNGISAQCIKTTDGQYTFYSVLRVQ